MQSITNHSQKFDTCIRPLLTRESRSRSRCVTPDHLRRHDKVHKVQSGIHTTDLGTLEAKPVNDRVSILTRKEDTCRKTSLAFLSGQTRAVDQLIRTERFDLSLHLLLRPRPRGTIQNRAGSAKGCDEIQGRPPRPRGPLALALPWDYMLISKILCTVCTVLNTLRILYRFVSDHY